MREVLSHESPVSFSDWLLLYANIQHRLPTAYNIIFFFFSDRGSEPSSPNETENPLDAAVKARRKDKDEEKETGGT